MHLFPKISLSIIAAVCAVISQTNYLRPLPPQIESVTVNSSNEVTIQIEPVRSDSFTDYKYHAVLVSDLSISLEKAFEAGKDKQRDTWISGTINSSNVLFSFPCKDSTRYYVAVRSSGKRVGPASGDERINSGWNLFIDSSSGVPLTVATGRQEGVSAQAHYLYRNSLNSGLDKAVGFFSFALNSPTNCSFEFKQNNTVLISINNLGAITNGSSLYKYGNISEAISAGNTDMKYMVLVRPNGDTTFFNVFALLENLNPADSLIYKLKSVPTNKIVSEGDIKIAVNSGLEDIINTSYQLCRLPSSDVPVNPISATNHSTITDSTLIRFLFSAIARLSLAHNSPKSNENEENAGIFTNYIQYFDYLVRNWNDIDNAGPGLPRLRSIYNSVCDLNKGIIIDPVWTKNHGTLSEFGKPVSEQERKNYAFYEGYTRLNLDLEKPGYSAGQNTGAGIMFRISDNIELYEANLADTFNMFGDPFIQGGETARRIIIPANDTLLGKLNTDGLWVKGINISQGEQPYYTGATAVRLPIRKLSTVPIDTAFIAENERGGMGDPVGKLVGSFEKSILKMSTITVNENLRFDTLDNVGDPGFLTHGESRLIEYDSTYLEDGNEIRLLMQGPDSIRNNILTEQSGNKFILHDTSQGVYNGKIVEVRDGKLVRVTDVYLRASSLGFVDAINGIISGIGSSAVPANIRIDGSKAFPDEFGAQGKVTVRWSPGLKVLNEASELIWPDKVEAGMVERTWNEYKTEILSENNIQIIPENGGKGWVNFSFHKLNEAEKSTCAKAMIVVNQIGFIDNKPDYSLSTDPDDMVDSDNFFLRQNNDHRNLDIYYSILPQFQEIEDVKIHIFEEENASPDITMDGAKGSGGKYLVGERIGPVTWNAEGIDGNVKEVGFYRIQLEVKIKGYAQSLKTEIEDADAEMPGWQCPQTCLAVHDLIWKHRPRVFVDARNDSSIYNFDAPIHPDDFIAASGLFEKIHIPGGLGHLITDPATSISMLSNSSRNHYLDLKNNIGYDNQVTTRKLVTDQPVVMYSTNITNSKTHVFLQFWFFSSWSASITDLENAWHEGDLEYFQIAIAKKDRRYISNNAGESKRDWVAPIGVFGSQHYYGQTLAWDRYTEHSRPQSQILQTSVTHEANRPYVYIARSTHATYFTGNERFSVENSKLGQFPMYKTKPWIGGYDFTGNKVIDNFLWLPLEYGSGVFKNWEGKWGYKDTPPDDDGGVFSMLVRDGPYGPPFRAAKHSKRGEVNLLSEPVFLHNSCIRNDRFVDENYRSELRIGE